MTVAADEKETHSLAELTLEVTQGCLDRLTSTKSLDDQSTVHALRVATKRLRAAWQLVKPLVGAELARNRNDALREMSGHLSESRDLAVLIGLVHGLAAQQSDGTMALALDKVGQALREPTLGVTESTLPPEETLELVRQTLIDEMAAWHSLDDCDPAVARRTIRHQLRKSRDRARRDARLAKNDHDAELWHDWRKMVKRLRYQREFVAATHDRQPGKHDARISRLGTRLGERNDLANLAAAADRLTATGKLERREHGLVRKAIAAEEHRLMKNCRRLGRQVSFKKGR